MSSNAVPFIFQLKGNFLNFLNFFNLKQIHTNALYTLNRYL